MNYFVFVYLAPDTLRRASESRVHGAGDARVYLYGHLRGPGTADEIFLFYFIQHGKTGK